jgi:hypothetical protein
VDSTYWRMLRLDQQIGTYFLAAFHEGIDADRIIYDVAKKPTLRPKAVPVLDADGLKVVYDETTGDRALNKNGSPRQSCGDGMKMLTEPETVEAFGDRVAAQLEENHEAHFRRMEIPRTVDDMMEIQHDIWQTGRAIADAMRLDRWPRNTASCRKWNTMCPYFEACCQGFGPRSCDELPAGYAVADSAHPELEGA